MSLDEARLTVDQIIKNVKLDPTVGQPYFKYPGIGMAAEHALITKSIAKNITGGGKFVADDVGGLIQKESDLLAFQKLFGRINSGSEAKPGPGRRAFQHLLEAFGGDTDSGEPTFDALNTHVRHCHHLDAEDGQIPTKKLGTHANAAKNF